MPDLTICVQVDLEAGLARAHKRNAGSLEDAAEARIDQQNMDFHRRVSAGYNHIALLEPQRFQLVDGSGPIERVAARIWARVAPLLTKNRTENVHAV
jgi:dTMP kinase